MLAVTASSRDEQTLPMTYAEYSALADGGVQAEWVDGKVILFMPPKVHQDMVLFLATLLRLFAQMTRAGWVLAAPFEMQPTPQSNAREPDILFVATENVGRFTEQKLAGPADLIVEVISDESVQRDRDDKFFEYQDAGVREYWIIDPRPRRRRADFFVLDDDGRYMPVPVSRDGIYHSTVLSDFWLDVKSLFGEELPDPLRTLARMVGPERIIAALGEQPMAP